MIHTVLDVVRDALRRCVGANPNGEEIVHVATPAKSVEGQRDCLGVTFLALEPEPHMCVSKSAAAALNLNVVFMVYASFSDYREGLRLLSACLECFQKTPHLGRSDFPALPMDGIFVEPHYFSADRLLSFWHPFDREIPPVLFFRLRSVAFAADAFTAEPVSEFGETWRT